MEIEVTQSRKVTVVAPTGALDTASAGEMKQTLEDLIKKGKSRLVVDLGRVTYMDSTGLGELVTAMKQARKAGGDLRLCTLNEDMRRIFEMTQLSEQIALFPTRPDAVASWK